MKVDFQNTETAFRGKSNADLWRSYFLFQLLNYPFLVRIGATIARFALLLHLPVRAFIRATIFQQFCGGETLDESVGTAKRLSQYGVSSILDVAVEGSQTETVFKQVTGEVLETIKLAESRTYFPFTVFKMTGIARSELLEKMDSPDEWAAVKKRVLSLCQTAFDKKVRILIDAEESWFQKPIDNLAQEMMQKFNQKEPLIYTTLQMYRKDRMEFFRKSLDHATQHHYILGVKLVRGAYLDKEHTRAAEKGLPSPVFDTKTETDRAFDEGILFAIDHIDKIALVAGTHNEKSTQLLIDEMEKRKIAPSDKRIFFSQLYGMSDHLSFHLAEKGYNVAKYLPFGDVRVLLPYLIRRAKENTAVHGQTPRELALLTRELKRRRRY